MHASRKEVAQATTTRARLDTVEAELAELKAAHADQTDMLETTRAFLASKSKLVAEKTAQVGLFAARCRWGSMMGSRPFLLLRRRLSSIFVLFVFFACLGRPS